MRGGYGVYRHFQQYFNYIIAVNGSMISLYIQNMYITYNKLYVWYLQDWPSKEKKENFWNYKELQYTFQKEYDI